MRGLQHDEDGNEAQDKLEVRVPVRGGPHDVSVAFLKTPAVLAEANRRPFLNPTVSNPGVAYLRAVTITGPSEQQPVYIFDCGR